MKKKKPTIKKLPKYARGGRRQKGSEQPINLGDTNTSMMAEYPEFFGDTNTSNNSLNAGQYAAIGQGAMQIGAGMSAYNNPNATSDEKSRAASTGINSGIDTAAGAVTPWYTYAKMGSDFGRQSFIKRDANGVPVNAQNKQLDAVMKPQHQMAIDDALKGNYGLAAAEMFLPGIGYESRSNALGMQKGINKIFGNHSNENNYQYPMGGIYDGISNAEVEKQELMRMPDGGTMQVDGPSHEQGGVPVNIPTGTEIFSDRLKMPGSKKTFAKMAEKYKTNKEDKLLDNDKVTNTTRKTAKLIADLKQRKLDELFQTQESLKQKKVQEYAKKMGYDLNNSQPNQMEGSDMVEYKDGGIHIKPENRGKFTAAANRAGMGVQEYARHILANKSNYSSTLVKRANFAHNAAGWHHADGGIQQYPNGGKKLPNIDSNLNFNKTPYYGQGYNPYEESLKPWQVNQSNDRFMNTEVNPGTYNEPVNIRKTYNPDYQGMTEATVNTGLQNLGNIWDLNLTKFGKKYDKEDSGQLTPERLNPREAIAQANMEARTTRNSLKDATGGNVGAYLSNLTRSQVGNTMNKARIIQDFENANVGIGNQFMMHNQSTRMLDKSNEQQNKARSEDIARQAIRGIGTNTSAAYRDYKAGQMDQNSVKMLSSAFANYGLDINNPYHWNIYFKKTQGGK